MDNPVIQPAFRQRKNTNKTKNTTQKTRDEQHGSYQKPQYRQLEMSNTDPTKKHNTEN